MRPHGSKVSETWQNPSRPGAKELRVLQGLVRPEEAAQVVDALEDAVLDEEAAGSQNPVQTPCLVLATRGRWLSGGAGGLAAPVVDQIVEIVEQRVVPRMRQVYENDDLSAAEVLLRRYMPEEKSRHALHFDYHATATCVVDLKPMEGSGLFVQPGAEATSRAFVPLRSAGDAAMHGWDLFHGVSLLEGHERVSLIVWAKPTADTESGRVSWYEGLGDEGDVDAAYRLAATAEERGNRAAALSWYERAAAAGHWMAMTGLARLLLASADVGDKEEALRWLQQAAEHGWADAQVALGDEYQASGDDVSAAKHYQAAAAQRHPAGLHRLGLVQLTGRGIPCDAMAAQQALEQSARLGWADAQFKLAQKGVFADVDEERRLALLSAAAAQGHPAATNSLAVVAAKDGRNEEARDLLQRAALKGHRGAMQNLAIFLQRGVGGPADPAAAAEWAERAATL